MTRASTPLDVIEGRARWCALVGDVRETLRTVPDGCAQTCVTSPPYYGLRDYGTASWVGGDPACDHRKVTPERAAVSLRTSTLGPNRDGRSGQSANGHQQEGFRVACGRCGAMRYDAQIGQEQSPAEYVAAMVAVMRDVRRVLADDGTLWVNIGDSYAASTRGSSGKGDKQRSNAGTLLEDRRWRVPDGFKPKDLLGIPWRLAFALQDDGWYLRSDIIWAKPNPMPESVTDRPTRAHEYVFLLSKRARYFYDADAIREDFADDRRGASGTKTVEYNVGSQRRDVLGSATKPGLGVPPQQSGRNARDVWTITPEPFAEAHFATMPPELARRCILAGSRVGDMVLDPFGGAGTTALVALQHGRRALLCELNPAYVDLQQKRLADFAADTTSPVRVAAPDYGPLFGGVR